MIIERIYALTWLFWFILPLFAAIFSGIFSPKIQFFPLAHPR